MTNTMKPPISLHPTNSEAILRQIRVLEDVLYDGTSPITDTHLEPAVFHRLYEIQEKIGNTRSSNGEQWQSELAGLAELQIQLLTFPDMKLAREVFRLRQLLESEQQTVLPQFTAA